jgi:hypothetical protein
MLKLVDGEWIKVSVEETYAAAANAENPRAKDNGLFRIRFNLLWLDGRKHSLFPYSDFNNPSDLLVKVGYAIAGDTVASVH